MAQRLSGWLTEGGHRYIGSVQHEGIYRTAGDEEDRRRPRTFTGELQWEADPDPRVEPDKLSVQRFFLENGSIENFARSMRSHSGCRYVAHVYYKLSVANEPDATNENAFRDDVWRPIIYAKSPLDFAAQLRRSRQGLSIERSSNDPRVVAGMYVEVAVLTNHIDAPGGAIVDPYKVSEGRGSARGTTHQFACKLIKQYSSIRNDFHSAESDIIKLISAEKSQMARALVSLGKEANAAAAVQNRIRLIAPFLKLLYPVLNSIAKEIKAEESDANQPRTSRERILENHSATRSFKWIFAGYMANSHVETSVELRVAELAIRHNSRAWRRNWQRYIHWAILEIAQSGLFFNREVFAVLWHGVYQNSLLRSPVLTRLASFLDYHRDMLTVKDLDAEGHETRALALKRPGTAMEGPAGKVFALFEQHGHLQRRVVYADVLYEIRNDLEMQRKYGITTYHLEQETRVADALAEKIDDAERRVRRQKKAQPQLLSRDKEPSTNSFACEQSGQTFAISHKLGHGAFGSVYECVDIENISEPLACKVTDVSSSSDVEGITAELSVMMRLRHPALPKLIAAVEKPNKFYLVIQKSSRGDLEQWLKSRNNNPTEDEIRYVFLQLLHVLRYLQANMVVHRDLKPENVLVHRDIRGFPVVKLIDFNLAAQLAAPITRSVNTYGTPDYFAPEFVKPIRTRATHGFCSDVWSLGGLLYELAAGESPFRGNKLTYEAPEWQLLNARFRERSPELQDLVKGMLTVDQSERLKLWNCLQHPWITKGFDDEENVPPLPDLDLSEEGEWGLDRVNYIADVPVDLGKTLRAGLPSDIVGTLEARSRSLSGQKHGKSDDDDDDGDDDDELGTVIRLPLLLDTKKETPNEKSETVIQVEERQRSARRRHDSRHLRKRVRVANLLRPADPWPTSALSTASNLKRELPSAPADGSDGEEKHIEPSSSHPSSTQESENKDRDISSAESPRRRAIDLRELAARESDNLQRLSAAALAFKHNSSLSSSVESVLVEAEYTHAEIAETIKALFKYSERAVDLLDNINFSVGFGDLEIAKDSLKELISISEAAERMSEDLVGNEGKCESKLLKLVKGASAALRLVLEESENQEDGATSSQHDDEDRRRSVTLIRGLVKDAIETFKLTTVPPNELCSVDHEDAGGGKAALPEWRNCSADDEAAIDRLAEFSTAVSDLQRGPRHPKREAKVMAQGLLELRRAVAGASVMRTLFVEAAFAFSREASRARKVLEFVTRWSEARPYLNPDRRSSSGEKDAEGVQRVAVQVERGMQVTSWHRMAIMFEAYLTKFEDSWRATSRTAKLLKEAALGATTTRR